MKLFRLIGTMTIVAAVAATMAVSASALTASYADNTVTLGEVATADQGDYTVVVTSAENGNDTTEGDIFQLAQTTAAPTTVAVPADLAPGKYYVRVGGYANGYENAEFVKTLATAATPEATYTDGEDDAVSTFTVTVDAPTGLTPYWYATIGGVAKKTANAATWANFAGNVKLALIYQGTETITDVNLIWE